MIKGESLAAGTEPAQTRCRKTLISSGVGLGGSSTMVGGGGGSGGVVIVEGVLLVTVVVCTAGSVWSLGASCSR